MSRFKGFTKEYWNTHFTVDFDLGKLSRLDGTEVGWVSRRKYTSYRIFRHKKKDILVHQLIYFLYHGEYDSTLVIDHIDGDGLNNTVVNLRQVTKSRNGLNKVETQSKNNKYRGVYWSEDRQKYFVQIQVDGVKHTLGRFDDIEVARCAYVNFKEQIMSDQ